MIPCEECITLALCRHKTEIVCEVLFEWLKSKRSCTETKVMPLEELDKHFPNTQMFGLSLLTKNQVTFFKKEDNNE